MTYIWVIILIIDIDTHGAIHSIDNIYQNITHAGIYLFRIN